MADIVTAQARSRMMSGIKATNTQPELIIRSGLHKLGYRYKLHMKSLPGKPDIVLPRYKAVIFVHGCFWHHHNCHLFKMPSSRTDFWKAKFEKNAVKNILKLDWRVCIVWECALKGKTRLSQDALFSMCGDWIGSEDSVFEIKGGLDEKRLPF